MQEKDMPRTIIELVQALPNYVRKITDFDCDKQIGKGGFGEVWHAIDNKTGAEVAVKELFAQKLKGRPLKAFIREIFTNAKCNDRFVIKLIGFTVEPPYCIVTQFAKGGCLADYLYPGMPKYNTIKPTNKTSIAMSLAYSLSKMQRMNIMHRDIKPANVLLNEKKTPYLCDFGIARIVDTENFMSKRSGTLIYMAPEVFNTREYTSSIDVYSFGIMLYEMSEMKHAYNGYTKELLFQTLTEGVDRPPFSKKTDPKLKELICACWEKNPQKRPTFHQIYMKFASGSVGFTGYNSKKIKVFAQSLKENERSSVKVPRQFYNVDDILNDLRQKVAEKIDDSDDSGDDFDAEIEEEENYIVFNSPQAIKGQKPIAKKIPRKIGIPLDNSDEENAYNSKPNSKTSKGSHPFVKLDPRILADANNPQWINHLHGVANSILKQDFEIFFNSTAAFIANPSNEILTYHVQYAYCEAMTYDHDFVSFCYAKTLYQHLPIQTPALLDLSLDMLGLLFLYQPSLVTEQLLDYIDYFISYKPEDMLIIISHLLRSTQQNLQQFMPIFDHLISQSQRFFDMEQADFYLTILTYLIENNNAFAQARFEIVRPIILFFTNSQYPNVSAAAYSAMARLWDGKFPLDFSLIAKHANNEIVAPAIASLLIPIYNMIPINPETIHLVLCLSALSEEANILPMLLAQSNPDAAVLIAKDNTWYSAGLPDYIGTYKLTLVLFGLPYARNELVMNERYQYLLSYLAAQPDNYVIGTIFLFLTKSNLNANFINQLSQAGFFSNFVASACQITDSNSIISCALLANALGSVAPCNDYPLFINLFIELAQQSNEAVPALIVSLAALSNHKNVAFAMKQQGTASYFIQFLRSFPNYQSYIQPALQNINNA